MTATIRLLDDSQSPFDRIRRVDPDGSEWGSAHGLGRVIAPLFLHALPLGGMAGSVGGYVFRHGRRRFTKTTDIPGNADTETR